ncbi:ABC-type hemin transport system substrate-binding protein [Rubellimicrobium aerolatum]|nr:ABC-type hemin transport system substrate-binding protein [Rubellimicrobium aerolatum]
MQTAEIPWMEVPEAAEGAGLLEKIAVVGEALGVPDRPRSLAAEVEAELAKAQAAATPEVERPRVIFVLSVQGRRIMGGSRGTATDGIIALAGGVNALKTSKATSRSPTRRSRQQRRTRS